MKRKSIILLVAIIIHLSFPSMSRGDFSQAEWQFFKEIELSPSSESEYAFFQVDREIYDGCTRELDSLRIIDGDAHETPYQIVTKRAKEKREQFFPRILNNSYLMGKYNSFVLDLGEETPRVNELTLVSTSKNFTRRASIEGGNDQTKWNLLVDETYIYDFSRNVRAKHLKIEFPLSNFRYLHIKVFDDGNGPLQISGAKIFRVRKEAAETESCPLEIIERTENDKNRTTEIVLDPGYQGLPIRQLKLNVESRNYHRKIKVESSTDSEKWVSLGEGIIFNYDLPEFKKTDNRVSFRENVRGRYFKLTIQNYDDQPLNVVGAMGSGLVRRVVFPVEGKNRYRVYFANPKSKAPRYDLVHRIPYLETERLSRLALRPRRLNPAYLAPAEPARPWTEEHAYLLWIIMAGAIIVLALLIFNLMRRTPPNGVSE